MGYGFNAWPNKLEKALDFESSKNVFLLKQAKTYLQWCRNRGGRGAALLPGGARGALLPFAFQYVSNEANAC